MTEAASPRITSLKWGRVSTEAGDFRDAKLWPGGGRNWDWNETGTHHRPGVQVDDISELLDRGAEFIVIGRGQHLRLQVTEEALDEIGSAGAISELMESSEAVARYNELVGKGRAVGALIHSTC